MRLYRALLAAALCCFPAAAQDLAILHARVYTSPTANAQKNATVLIRSGKIAAVGASVKVPGGVTTLDCRGCVVQAGFWNTHVHFLEPRWANAAHLPAAQLTQQVQAMVTHAGFTTVVDTGSDPVDTIALRRRIEAGEVSGPHIYTAGFPLYPSHAVPFYLADLPKVLHDRLPQPATPAEATEVVKQDIAAGTDIVKLFTGSIVAPNKVVPMSGPIVSAAAAEAHRHRQLVFTHATNLEGLKVGVDNGVDVIAHAPEITDGIDDAMLHSLVARHVSMIPTLKLFSGDANIAEIRSLLMRFHRMGGVLMFGTDTGFLPDYSMEEEFRQLSLAGFSFRDILAMLTTEPASRFGVAQTKGRIAPGMSADLTILSEDPAAGDPLAFTKVHYVIRNGRKIFGED